MMNKEEFKLHTVHHKLQLALTDLSDEHQCQ